MMRLNGIAVDAVVVSGPWPDQNPYSLDEEPRYAVSPVDDAGDDIACEHFEDRGDALERGRQLAQTYGVQFEVDVDEE